MLRLRRHGEVGAAAVAAAAGEDVRDVPTGHAGCIALDDTEHPRGRQHDGEAVVLEGAVPVLGPAREVRRQVVVLHGRVVDLLQLRVGAGDDVTVFGVLPQHLVLVAPAGRDRRRGVVEGHSGVRGLELLADCEEVVPRSVISSEELGDRLTVAGQSCGLEEVGTVGDGGRADVGGVAEELAIGRRGEVHVPLVPAALDVGRGEVYEVVGVLEHLRQPAVVHADDVGESGPGAEGSLELLLGFVAGGELVLLDGDVGVEFLVLLDQVVVSPLAEGGDRQGHLAVRARVVRSAGRAAGEEDERGCGKQHQGLRD